MTIDENTLQEESAAADSLKPNSSGVSDDKTLTSSKVAMMKSLMGMTSAMDKEDMTEWFKKAMALLGHEADKVGDHSGKNSASIDATTGAGPKTKDAMPKLSGVTPGQSMKEDVADLFGSEELSEEFIAKAADIFEAAVASHIILKGEELAEEYEAKFNEAVEAFESEQLSNLDKYLDYAVSTWIAENEVALESSLRSEITADFLTGFKNLCVEHNIELPEDKVDVVEEMATKVAELEEALNKALDENLTLKESALISSKNELIESASADLTALSKEKFVKVALALDFDGDEESFNNKLSVVKEAYFSEQEVTKSTPDTNLEDETFEGDNIVEETVIEDPSVRMISEALSRQLKK